VIRRPHGVPDLAGWRGPLHFFLTALAEPLAERTCARRCAVRFRAAAVAAFFARALRSAAVMFFAAFLPPCLPYSLPILRRNSSTSGGMRLGMA
jgi:hypothetical protein